VELWADIDDSISKRSNTLKLEFAEVPTTPPKVFQVTQYLYLHCRLCNLQTGYCVLSRLDTRTDIPGKEGGGSAPPREGWLASGGEYVGNRARRAYANKDGDVMGKLDGTIVAWLPPGQANFVNESSQKRVALWKIKYDDTETVPGVLRSQLCASA
jgi:hypothetical protein